MCEEEEVVEKRNDWTHAPRNNIQSGSPVCGSKSVADFKINQSLDDV